MFQQFKTITALYMMYVYLPFLLSTINAMVILVGPITPVTTTEIGPIIPVAPNNRSTLEYPIDLAFIMDSTGSMSSYIHSAKENIHKIAEQIVASSRSDVRLALIEYRDHKPEDRTFVTCVNDFTDSLQRMKSWLTEASASGGGDLPEAVADSLVEATKLSWRSESTKISVLISDAPPHGLDPYSDTSFENGCPLEHDPLKTVRKLAELGVTLYSVGCEPSILQYKDFFEALAFLTGGQYIPMSDPDRLIDAIIGGTQEELSLNQYLSEIKQEINETIEAGEEVDEQQIAARCFEKLKSRGAKSTHLMKNNEVLAGPSESSKLLSEATSMVEAKKAFAPSVERNSGPIGFYESASYIDDMDDLSDYLAPALSIYDSPYLSEGARGMYGPAVSSAFGMSSGPYMSSDYGTARHAKKETFSTVESDISLDQIERMVKKETSKL